jgi:hypothetical protein
MIYLITSGCSKGPSSKTAASEVARRTFRYVEPLSEARTKLADFFSILLVSSRRLDRPSGCPVAFARVTLGRLLMNHKVLKFVSILLVLCVLSVGGLAQAQLVEHAGHHAHHQAATHGTVLCSWMCAAGEILDSAVVTFQAELSPIALITFPNSARTSIEACQTSPSRAPPSFSL